MARTSRSSSRSSRSRSFFTRPDFVWRDTVPFWALVAFLILVFLTGGASRADVLSLIILRPAAVIFCGIALWSLRWDDVKAHRFLFSMAATIFALVGLHLVPLPPSIWGALPGRELLVEIDKVAELGEVWRPITMVPPSGWNAFWSLFVPLAVLLLGVQVSRGQRFQLLPVILGLGLLSGLVGLMQSIGDPQGALYFYAVTNNGAAVGFFANRNHQAVLLATLFPMLAVYASAGIKSEQQMRFRSWAAIAAGLVLIPLLLVTGSRAGLITGVLGLLCAAWIYRKPELTAPKRRVGAKVIDWRWPLIGFGVLCMGALTILMSRAEALNRLTAVDSLEEERFKVWPVIGDLVWKYFPVGSGAGSFIEVYQIDEPYELLSPEYYNHAHNDWLEVPMTFGLPGMALLLAAVGAWLVVTAELLKRPAGQGRDIPFARVSASIILILALASIGDYPLRTPILMSLIVIAALWISGAGAKRGGTVRDSSLGSDLRDL